MTERDGGRAEERIRREASDWFAHLRGEPTDDEVRDFETWRDADPAHAETYERIAAQWERTAFLRNSELVNSRDLGRAALRPPRGQLPGRLIGGLAAAAAIALALGFTIANGSGYLPPPASSIDNSSPRAGERIVRLADGSTALLASGSAMEIAFGPDERRIVLTGGRVRFDVAHDASRPFIVAAAGGSIIAHGTVFEVSLDDGRVAVVLLEGSVEVRQPRLAMARQVANPVFLDPGEETQYAGQESAVPAAITARTEARLPMIAFENNSLRDAAAKFASGGGPDIRVEGRAAALRISGVFRSDDPEGFARAAAATFGLGLTRRNGELILTSK